VIRVEKHIAHSLVIDYGSMFQSIFGVSDPYQAPETLFMVYDGETLIGMLAGYLRDTRTFYIQYGGLLPENVKQYRAKGLFDQAVKAIEEPIVALSISNKNRPALRLVLASGFTIVGVRVDLGNNVFVDFIKDKSHG